MARPRKFVQKLAPEDRTWLEAIVHSPTAEQRLVTRARVILACADGKSNDAIREETGLSKPSIINILKKWVSLGVQEALKDLPRSGRPKSINEDAQSWVISLVCSSQENIPAVNKAQQWTITSLTEYVRQHCLEEGFKELVNIQRSSVWNILKQHNIASPRGAIKKESLYMDKMRMETTDMTAKNIDKISALFPNCITETKDAAGNPKKAVNFELLRQMLSHDVAKGNEVYEFTWVGKKAAIVEANTPIRKTLRPCPEISSSWDDTENLYIEGDNLDALKLLQESYRNKVKMIYIDPPYNTGNDFIYKDDFKKKSGAYAEDSGVYDEDGKRMFRNTDSNGHFHSDWCSMMYSRLLLARNMLCDDGAIFISIDDNESSNLVQICDEIFGFTNRIALICHKSRASVSNDKIISPNHNTILFYAKNIVTLEDKRKFIGLDPVLDGFDLDDNDGRGSYRLVPVDGPGGAKKGNPFFEFLGIQGYWRFSKETMQKKYDEGLVVRKGNSLYQKYFKTTAEQTRRTATTWWDDAGLTSSATSKLKALMGGTTFDTPKPVELLSRMLKMITFQDRDAIILDFFSGSATTAHAVMQLNAEDCGSRKFIMVQLPERTDEKSEAFKAGYKNICEIGRERIRRAALKIAEDHPGSHFDGGFRVLKIDSTNMKDVYYRASEYSQEMLPGLESNIKDDRSDLDLLFGCLTDWGLPLSLPYKSGQIDGCTVHNYSNGALIACFDKNVPDSVFLAIAKKQPLRAVFRDSCFENSPSRINVTEIFRNMAPDTEIKVL